MTNRLVLVFCLAVLPTLGFTAEVSDFGWRASGSVFASIYDDQVEDKSASGEFGVNLADGIDFHYGSAQASGDYHVSGEDLSLRATTNVVASGEREVNETFYGAAASTRATITWFDSITVQGDAPLPFGVVFLNWQIDGTFSGTVDQSGRFASSSGWVEFDVPTSDDPIVEATRSMNWNDEVLTITGPQQVSRIVSFSQVLETSGATPVEAVFTINAFTNGGTMSAQFGGTAKLSSITFEDGTTPESHGFAISFASGTNSPNAVPEPSSTVLAILVVGGVGYWRRKQKPKSSVN